MANNKEKELVGLPKEATDEQFLTRISTLLDIEKKAKIYIGLPEDTGVEELMEKLTPQKVENVADEKLQVIAESYFKDNPFAKECYINNQTGDLYAMPHQFVLLGASEDVILVATKKENKISLRPLKP